MDDTTVPCRSTAVIVDDHPASRRYLAAIAGEFGLRTRCCADALEALQCIPRLRPLLLVTDLNLPGMDGLRMLRRLRQDWPAQAPWPGVLVVSADASLPGHHDDALVRQSLRKPVEPARLRSTLAEMLNRPEPARLSPDLPRPHPLDTRFAADLCDDIDALDRCLAEHRLDRAIDILHRMIGGSAMMGEPALAARLRDLLDAARAGATPGQLACLYYGVRTEVEYRLAVPVARAEGEQLR